jgi:hypothetical protein
MVGSKGDISVAPLTGFGGYNLQTTVRQIGARWLVPTISATSTAGVAATWVGAQNLVDSHFIQLGILEICSKTGAISYQAFWSDTAENFVPQTLGTVRSNDEVTASMARNKQGWELDFRDKTSGFSVIKQVVYAAGATFSQAEWLQEDPSPSDIAARDVPYPEMSNVKFERLRVNGAAPSLKLSDGATLITSNGVLRVPTRVRDDSFTFVQPVGPAAQYLSDAKVLDAEVSSFDADRARWKSISKRSKRDDVHELEGLYLFFATEMTAQGWPESTRKDVLELTKELRQYVSDFSGWAASGFKDTGKEFEAIKKVALRENRTVDELRAGLGLPPP